MEMMMTANSNCKWKDRKGHHLLTAATYVKAYHTVVKLTETSSFPENLDMTKYVIYNI